MTVTLEQREIEVRDDGLHYGEANVGDAGAVEIWLAEVEFVGLLSAPGGCPMRRRQLSGRQRKINMEGEANTAKGVSTTWDRCLAGTKPSLETVTLMCLLAWAFHHIVCWWKSQEGAVRPVR